MRTYLLLLLCFLTGCGSISKPNEGAATESAQLLALRLVEAPLRSLVLGEEPTTPWVEMDNGVRFIAVSHRGGNVVPTGEKVLELRAGLGHGGPRFAIPNYGGIVVPFPNGWSFRIVLEGQVRESGVLDLRYFVLTGTAQ